MGHMSVLLMYTPHADNTHVQLHAIFVHDSPNVTSLYDFFTTTYWPHHNSIICMQSRCLHIKKICVYKIGVPKPEAV